ncbi:MAG: carbon-nitrogen hydrolase family protein [Ramlibacter sp.]|nr:carbon-nitrogen hydrolase family protein [Ramlibacter sp.]
MHAPHPPHPPRIAIGQLRMHWTIEENMQSIQNAIVLAHSRGASICSFPELAITGFHRRIVEHAFPEKIAPEVERLKETCAQLNVAVAVGAPTFEGATRFNSHLLIDQQGQLVQAVRKNGLTAPEATFFTAGTARPSATLHGVRCTAVICREIEDEEEVMAQLEPGSVNLVFWPGQMRPDPDKPPQDPPAHVVQAQNLARRLRAFVVQANWPNALNRPEESANTGRSAVISDTGELVFRLPEQEPGVAVFTLGERTHEWHPQA